jgi:hypothetical protein
MQYRNICDPSINHDEWTEEERMKLQDVVRLYQEHDWCSIADAVGNNRTPLQCLQTYQVGPLPLYPPLTTSPPPFLPSSGAIE